MMNVVFLDSSHPGTVVSPTLVRNYGSLVIRAAL
jgi:hypothetical protein